MIPADQLQLITAAVDGELSAADARAFRRLLDGSAEARTLYVELKAHSDRVRTLPQAAPPPDLRAQILARAARAPAPKAAPHPAAKPLPFRRAAAVLVPVALAAGLLLCVTAGSFVFFNSQTRAKNALAKHRWSDDLPARPDTPAAAPLPAARDATPFDPDADPADVSPVPPLPAPRLVPPAEVAVAPQPRPVQRDLIGARILPPLRPFDFVQVRVPFLRAVAELDRDDTQQELAEELARDPAFRFDLFVRDTPHGVTVFQNAAKAAGLTVHADAATLDRLKKRQAHAVVVYTESLTAAELTALFAQVCAADMKFTPRVCDSLHVTPVVRHDETELKAVLGTDVGLFKRPAGTSGAGQVGARLTGKSGEPKSVSAGTIDSVVQAVTKSPAAKHGEKPAVLLTWQTTHPGSGRTNPAQSKELKQFFAKRGDRKPNAIPAIIVIRPVG